MSYAKIIKWNSKHRKGISYKKGYMGFNPSGMTSEQLDERESNYKKQLSEMTPEQRTEVRDNIIKMQEVWTGSYPWEWCVFIRTYGLK